MALSLARVIRIASSFSDRVPSYETRPKWRESVSGVEGKVERKEDGRTASNLAIIAAIFSAFFLSFSSAAASFALALRVSSCFLSSSTSRSDSTMDSLRVSIWMADSLLSYSRRSFARRRSLRSDELTLRSCERERNE